MGVSKTVPENSKYEEKKKRGGSLKVQEFRNLVKYFQWETRTSTGKKWNILKIMKIKYINIKYYVQFI